MISQIGSEFARGFLMCPDSIELLGILPNHWLKIECGEYSIWHDPRLPCLKINNSTYLVGHVYDPWQGFGTEGVIEQLKKVMPSNCLPSLQDEKLWSLLDSVSGRFVLLSLKPSMQWIVSDAVGLRPCYYATSEAGFFASSHSGLLADAAKLHPDPMVTELVSAKFYKIGVRHLPGLKTPFNGMQRLAANHYLEISTGQQHRFFPRAPHGKVENWEGLVERCAKVMKESVRLLCQEHDVVVSLSMGTDSRCTLAACKDMREHVSFFSYASNNAEAQDAEGAAKLCKTLGLRHEFYPVDVDGYLNSRDTKFEELLCRNAAGIRVPKLAEIAKLKTLLQEFAPGRLELKTHVSEVGRAFYCKKQNVNTFPVNLTARDMSNLYKKNMFNRRLLRWTDEAFDEFREQTKFGERFFDYEQHDMFYWEHRMTQWGALANQDHDIVHEMTTIFNNRKLLSNLLKPSLLDRISDRLHRDVIKKLWPEVMCEPLKSGPSGFRSVSRKTAECVFFRLNRF